jgi:hypothetical protein
MPSGRERMMTTNDGNEKDGWDEEEDGLEMMKCPGEMEIEDFVLPVY